MKKTENKQQATELAHELYSKGAKPAVISHLLIGILNTEAYSFFEQMAEAGAALQRQADQENAPRRWDDFLTDLGNIASIFYEAEHNREPLQALLKILNEARDILLQETLNNE